LERNTRAVRRPIEFSSNEHPGPQKIIPPVITPANGFPETDWQTLLANSLTSADQLAAHLTIDRDAIERVIARYPMRINP